MSALNNLFNLKHQLVLYGAHHNNKINVFIHIVCVPIIFWTALVFAASTRPLVDVNALPTSLQWLKLFGPDLVFFTVVSTLSITYFSIP